jgi:serine/threonine protein kinase
MLIWLTITGDIKDENIVVDKNFRVKLIDFGSAIIYDARKPPPYHNRFFGVSRYYPATTSSRIALTRRPTLQTVNFAASEILQGKSYRAPHAEVWYDFFSRCRCLSMH